MDKHRNKRKLKNYLFVNRAQITVAVSNIILLVLMFAVVIATVLLPVYSDIFRSEEVYLQHLSSKLFLLLLERSAIAFCVLFLVILLFQIIVVHRVCGPLVSFKKTLDKLCKGDFSRKVFLRRGDYFKKEASQLNEILESVSFVISTSKKCHHEVIDRLDKIQRIGIREDEVDSTLSTIYGQTEHVLGELSKFKLLEPEIENDKDLI